MARKNKSVVLTWGKADAKETENPKESMQLSYRESSG